MRFIPAVRIVLAAGSLFLLTARGADSAPGVVAAKPATDKPALPAQADLRPEFTAKGLVPRRQGGRPTCSVFTMTGAIEFAAARRSGQTPRLSVEFLNWAACQACRRVQDGGFFSDLWRGFEVSGICSEAAMPYGASFNTTNRPAAAALAEARDRAHLGLELRWIKRWDVKTGLTTAEFDRIKQTLAGGWPVCGGLRWPKRAVWKNGVLQMCGPDDVFDGHSVLVVGFRDEPAQPGGGVLIFRNSSGDGHDGQMPYAYAQAYMNDAAFVQGDAPTPRE